MNANESLARSCVSLARAYEDRAQAYRASGKDDKAAKFTAKAEVQYTKAHALRNPGEAKVQSVSDDYLDKAAQAEEQGDSKKAAKYLAKAEKSAPKPVKSAPSASLAQARASAVNPNKPDHFRVDVTENIGTTGFGSLNNFRYRFTVVRISNGEPMKTGYGITQRSAWDAGQKVVQKLCK